jgi:hypothetical protein
MGEGRAIDGRRLKAAEAEEDEDEDDEEEEEEWGSGTGSGVAKALVSKLTVSNPSKCKFSAASGALSRPADAPSPPSPSIGSVLCCVVCRGVASRQRGGEQSTDRLAASLAKQRNNGNENKAGACVAPTKMTRLACTSGALPVGAGRPACCWW